MNGKQPSTVWLDGAGALESSLDYNQSTEANPDPDQLSESPQEREGNAGEIGIAEGFQ